MKNLLLVLAALFVLTTATVPSFADGNPNPHVYVADGNPNPHACVGSACNPLPTAR